MLQRYLGLYKLQVRHYIPSHLQGREGEPQLEMKHALRRERVGHSARLRSC